MSHNAHLPSVAIIVLTWNGRDLTLDCLASLVHLTYPNHAIFVVDNGSHDDTVDAIRRQFPTVTIIQNGDNLGFAEGNNAGIRHVLAAGFDYVLLLNNDTVVDSKLLHELVNVGDADATVGVIGPVIYYHHAPDVIWSAGNVVDWRSVALRRLHADTRGPEPTNVFEVDYVTGCALCIKREVIERIGLLDPRYFIYFEETDWCFRARARGYRVVVAPRARIWHKVSATMQPDSPATTYYMSRNVFLFAHSHLAGFRRLGALARVSLQQARVVLAQSFRPRHAPLRRNRDARLLAVRDACLGRWGKMGPDVADVC